MRSSPLLPPAPELEQEQGEILGVVVVSFSYRMHVDQVLGHWERVKMLGCFEL
jgi:hypothetical protein